MFSFPRTLAAVFSLALVAGCQVTTVEPGRGTEAPRVPTPTAPQVDRIPQSQAVANFRAVVARVEPVAERTCRERTRDVNCDFQIVVDTRNGLPPNAFQTLDRSGRPVVGFTTALIADARNQDEIAFVLGHETAHHIEGHIPRQRQQAAGGAIIGTLAGAALGADAATLETLQRVGGTIGARSYAKSFELEADALGTVITQRAGYNAVRGAEFFNRIPDPGDRFLGTHPPNADRIATVRRVGRPMTGLTCEATGGVTGLGPR